MPTQQSNQPLPPGFQLDRYRIDRQLSVGGFSIVYLAYDEEETPVAIKEYLPNSLALRTEGAVPVITEEHRGAFRHGMKCFFEEGRSLAHLSHPNIVRVLNFFRANETVYMVMVYERGRTLQEHIRKAKGVIKEGFVRSVFSRLLNGLREVHAQKLLHLDIKPANVYLRTDGSPVLLDFGAARQALSTDGPNLKPMYTPGYAAPEQYEAPDQLGPWTDIYAVGASIYTTLGGTPPPAASARLLKDELVPAEKRWAGRYSKHLLETVDWCMQLDYLERPLSVFALQKALAEGGEPRRDASWADTLSRRLKGLMGI
ncbi:MAG: serine/threonine protein kinase [Ignavibacteria bacterium]